MSFQDKSINCFDCGTIFIFSADEQELFEARGYSNEPKRCPECRQLRKLRNGNSVSRTPRQMFPATCTDCGRSTEVPFQPHNGKPVYCSACYQKVRPVRY